MLLHVPAPHGLVTVLLHGVAETHLEVGSPSTSTKPDEQLHLMQQRLDGGGES